MKKLKIGTEVRFTDDYVEFKSRNADNFFDFPSSYIDKDRTNIHGETREECLSAYMMSRYSYEFGEEIHGVIVGNNGFSGEDFAYIVWFVNKIGEDISYIRPEDLEVL